MKALMVAMVALLPTFASPVLAHSTGVTQPNVVIIMSDDQRWDTATPKYMPNLNADLVPNGVTFPQAFVSNSLCCPSRTSTLTGNYSHDTGVYGNLGEWGGYSAFMQHGTNSASNIATDLHGAGYETALIGKYLNNYPAPDNFTEVPSYWDRWFAVPTGSFYDYDADVGGVMRHYGSRTSDYIGHVLTDQATSFISQAQSDSKPFFLYLTPTAPHTPSTADPRDVDRFSARVPRTPSWGGYSHDHLATKPHYVRSTEWRPDHAEGVHHRMVDSIYSVDRIVGSIWDAAPPDTIVLYMSDNGYMWGEHRRLQKQVPYSEAIRIPMVLAYKGAGSPIPTGASSSIALNVDVRPTLEALAGVPLSEPVDGLDMLGPTRTDFALEHWEVPSETDVPEYCGVRSAGWMYVRYGGSTNDDGFEELYNEARDPYELSNLAPRGSAKLDSMRAKAGAYCTAGAYHPSGWPFP